MGNRTLAAAFLTSLAIAAGLIYYRRAPAPAFGRPVTAGAEIARLLSSKAGADVNESNPEIVIAWVFRTEDCLSCQGWSWAFRRIQQKYAEQVKLYALHVGDDVSAVDEFFRRERLAGSLVHLRPREYRRVFGSTALPALYLLKGETVVAVRSGKSHARDGSQFVKAVAKELESHDEDGLVNPG